MFTIVKTSTTNTITVTTSSDYSQHQLTIIPSSDATQGDFDVYVAVGGQYVQLRGASVKWDIMRPIPIDGIFAGFKLTSSDYDGSNLQLEYIGRP